MLYRHLAVRAEGAEQWAVAERNSWAVGGRHKGRARLSPGAQEMPLFQSVQTDCGSHPTLYSMDRGDSSTGCKADTLKISGAIPSNTPYGFVVYTGTILPLASRRIEGRVEERDTSLCLGQR